MFATVLASCTLMLAATAMAPASAADDASAAASAGAAAPSAVAPAAAAPAVITSAAPAATATATAAAPAASAAPAAPVPNKGDTAWLLVCTAFVILMTLPGLGLFYGGLVRSKNMLSVLMQCFTIFSLIIVLWIIYGYSVAFTEGNSFFGGFSRLFLHGMTPDSVAGTFSKGVIVPEFAYVVFQGAFAAITCALIIGAFAERAKFSAILVFTVLWFTFAYLPIAHMVWFWPGPDGFTDAAAAEKLTAAGGWLFQKGALDFAGGTVVHINAAIAGLVGSYVIGKRVGFGKEAFKPHSLALTMVGASLLWFGVGSKR
jgi:Amt family ammonium transporter